MKKEKIEVTINKLEELIKDYHYKVGQFVGDPRELEPETHFESEFKKIIEFAYEIKLPFHIYSGTDFGKNNDLLRDLRLGIFELWKTSKKLLPSQLKDKEI